MAGTRGNAASRILFIIDDEPNLIKKVAGGNMKAETVTMNLGTDKKPIHTISNVTSDELTAEIGFSMGGSMLQWFNAFMDNDVMEKQGSIQFGNQKQQVTSIIDARDLWLTEISFPACDASSKDSAFIEFKCRGEEYTRKAGDNAAMQASTNFDQKGFMAANFSLSVGDLDCSKVKKTGKITCKMKLQQNPVGSQRIMELVPTVCELGDFEVTIDRVTEASWVQYYEDFVIKGNCGQSNMVNATLEYKTQNLEKTLATIEMTGMSPFELKHADVEAQKDAVGELTIKFKVEDYTIKMG
jgi:hypothetical protein